MPAPSFTYFLDILVNTIRDEIAACMEKSFDKIHISEAAKMLSITNINVMKEYGSKVKLKRLFNVVKELIKYLCFCRENGS